jgi:hypothetical protein
MENNELKAFEFKAVNEDGDSTVITVFGKKTEEALKTAQEQAKNYGMVIKE